MNSLRPPKPEKFHTEKYNKSCLVHPWKSIAEHAELTFFPACSCIVVHHPRSFGDLGQQLEETMLSCRLLHQSTLDVLQVLEDQR